LEVADVFRAHGEAFRQRYRLSGDQLKVMRAIEVCRTDVLGGHVDVCPDCNYQRISYNSCRNRHCPKCQALPAARWLERRMQRVLPTHYFHVVFTLPSELRPLARLNRVHIFDLLFASAAQALLELGADPKRLGGQLGITMVLHTWTRELKFHPHVHCITTGGGLAFDGQRWRSTRTDYLFPVKVLAKLFRGKFLHGLARLYAQGQLLLDERSASLADPQIFAAFRDQLYRTDWVVYAKPPFRGPEHVYRYLGRYTHRVAISNQRMRSIDSRGVSFLTKHGRSITLDADTFVHRFLLHVLPPRFVKIRHFGLHASSNATTRLELARRLLDGGVTAPASVESTSTQPVPTWQQLLHKLTGTDPSRCPRCTAQLVRLPLPFGFTQSAAAVLPTCIDTS
jgi:hypothetical protein